jgi:Multiubiquitin
MISHHDKLKDKKEALQFTINSKCYEWHQQYITGAEIRKLAKISKEDDIFLSIKKPWEDELILDETKVNLARPEIEHFFSKEKEIKICIIINGREKFWTKKKISFEEVVELGLGSYNNNPNTVYTVIYDRGPKENTEGSMVRGDQVIVKNKMIFNVSATDKS